MGQDDSDPLKDKVANWLKTQGYPLEMEVAKVFLENHYSVTQGYYFIDHDSGKPREIDILASQHIVADRLLANFEFVVECKKATQPFIAFTHNIALTMLPFGVTNASYLLSVTMTPATTSGEKLISLIMDEDYHSILPIFNKPIRSGYGFIQSNLSKAINPDKESKDNAYDALMKVIKAANDRVSYHEPLGVIRREELFSPVAYIGFPLIVIDGSLFDCYLDKSGELVVDAVTELQVSITYPKLGYIPVRICVKDALPSIVEEMSSSIEIIQREGKNTMEELYTQLPNSKDLIG